MAEKKKTKLTPKQEKELLKNADFLRHLEMMEMVVDLGIAKKLEKKESEKSK